MIERRDVLKIGATGAIAFGFPAALRANPFQFEMWIEDRRFGVAKPDMAHAISTHIIDGDVTRLWTDALSTAWKKPGFSIAGATGADALFVLETLAWQHGRKVTQRQSLAPKSAELPELFFWRIEPTHPNMKG